MYEPIPPKDRELHKVDTLIVRREMRVGSRVLTPGEEFRWRSEKMSWRDVVILHEQAFVDTPPPPRGTQLCPYCTEYFMDVCPCRPVETEAEGDEEVAATEEAVTEVAATEEAVTEVAATEEAAATNRKKKSKR